MLLHLKNRLILLFIFKHAFKEILPKTEFWGFFFNLEHEFPCYQLQETFGFLNLSFSISNMQFANSLFLPHKFKDKVSSLIQLTL